MNCLGKDGERQMKEYSAGRDDQEEGGEGIKRQTFEGFERLGQREEKRVRGREGRGGRLRRGLLSAI